MIKVDTRFYCDICQKEVFNADGVLRVELPYCGDDNDGYTEYSAVSVDLCHECAREMINFISSKYSIKSKSGFSFVINKNNKNDNKIKYNHIKSYIDKGELPPLLSPEELKNKRVFGLATLK